MVALEVDLTLTTTIIKKTVKELKEVSAHQAAESEGTTPWDQEDLTSNYPTSLTKWP